MQWMHNVVIIVHNIGQWMHWCMMLCCVMHDVVLCDVSLSLSRSLWRERERSMCPKSTTRVGWHTQKAHKCIPGGLVSIVTVPLWSYHLHTHTHTRITKSKIKIFISRCDWHRADKVGRITYVYTYVWYIHTYGLVLLWSKLSTERNLWNLLHREDVIYGMGGRIGTYHVCTYIRTCVYTYICMYTDILLKHSVST